MSMSFNWELADLPTPEPLREAVRAGIFGICADGTLTPSPTEVASLTEEQARELVSTLCDLRHLRRCLERHLNPHTCQPLRSWEIRERVERSMRQGVENLAANYGASLEAYVTAFGAEAGEELDAYVRGLLERPEFALGPIEIQQSLF